MTVEELLDEIHEQEEIIKKAKERIAELGQSIYEIVIKSQSKGE